MSLLATKKKAFTVAQERVLIKHRLNSHEWELKQEFPSSMIIRHRVTGEYRSIEKHPIPKRLGS